MCEQWCGHALTPVRFFGVRRYRRGAALESHVDSDPMARAVGVSITVDVEGLEAPWLLQAAAAEGEPGTGAALPVSAVGVVSYNGYISGAKQKSAQNVMQQISLAQTEEYSNSQHLLFL